MFAGYGLARHTIRGTIMLKYLLAALALITAPAAYGDEVWHVFDYECDPASGYFYIGMANTVNRDPEDVPGDFLYSNRVFKPEEWGGYRRVVLPSEGLEFESNEDNTESRAVNQDENPILVSCEIPVHPPGESAVPDEIIRFEVNRSKLLRNILRGPCSVYLRGEFEILANGSVIDTWPGPQETCAYHHAIWNRYKSVEYSRDHGFSRCTSTKGGGITDASDIELTCDTTTPDFPAVPPAE